MPKLIKKYQKLSNYYYLLILFGLIENCMVLGYTLSENNLSADFKSIASDESNENSISILSNQHASHALTGENHRHHHKHPQENHPHLFRHRHHQKKQHISNLNSRNQKDQLSNGSLRLEKAIDEFKRYQFERIKNTTDVIPTTNQNYDIIATDINLNAEIVKAKDDFSTTSKPYTPRTTTLSTAKKHRKLTKKSHHLRHHNRHHQVWEKRVFPSLNHQLTTSFPATEDSIVKPNNRKNSRQNPNKYNKQNFNTTLSTRHFDRDGLYLGLHNMENTKHNTKYIQKNKYNFNRKSFDEQQLNIDDSIYSEFDNSDFDNRKKKFSGDNLKKKKIKTKSLQTELDNYDDDDDDDDDDDNGSDDYSAYVDDSNEENNLKINRINSKLSNHPINNEYNDDIYSRSYIPGALTKHKYEMLGTRDAVQETRNSYITNQRHHKSLATQHITKISREASCGMPKPKVEKIQHDTSKLYVPHCTILHRCGDDTGCCMSDAKTCTAKKTQDIDLYFFVRSIDSKQGTIERITFKNHTECHCVKKPPKHHTNFLLEPANIRKATVLDCNCPKLFEKILEDNGNCRCDCSSSNSNCDWLKRGMEHFSMVDRRCISEGRCKPPTCEFGSYVKKNGRCPRKDDKMATNFSTRNFH